MDIIAGFIVALVILGCYLDSAAQRQRKPRRYTISHPSHIGHD